MRLKSAQVNLFNAIGPNELMNSSVKAVALAADALTAAAAAARPVEYATVEAAHAAGLVGGLPALVTIGGFLYWKTVDGVSLILLSLPQTTTPAP